MTLVTGASQGVGRAALALRLARGGFGLVAADLLAERKTLEGVCKACSPLSASPIRATAT